jgi:hydrogenase-4 component B
VSGAGGLVWLVLALVIAQLLLGCLAAAAPSRFLKAVYPSILVSAGLLSALNAFALLAQVDVGLVLPLGLPVVGLHLRLDGLAAYFGLIVNLGVAAASLYGLGFDRERELSGRVEPFFAGFTAAMNLVVIADDAFTFLFAWEVMSLSSWVLVISRHEDRENWRAGHVYLLMAAMGTIALLFAFGGLAGAAGTYAFDAIRTSPPGPSVAVLVIGAALVGAGSKAGLMPFHAWLPLAHPAAPSHVSVLMSGVMTKVAIYGLLRITFDLLGPPLWWWSLPFILLGSVTAVGGLLYAIVDQDLKRVLAYSPSKTSGSSSRGSDSPWPSGPRV